jgi:hypothetical protein
MSVMGRALLLLSALVGFVNAVIGLSAAEPGIGRDVLSVKLSVCSLALYVYAFIPSWREWKREQS